LNVACHAEVPASSTPALSCGLFLGELLVHLDVRLSHLHERPTVDVLARPFLVSAVLRLEVVFIVENFLDLLLREVGLGELLVELFRPLVGLGRVGPLYEHVVPLDRLEEGVPHDLQSAFRPRAQALGRVPVQEGNHQVLGLSGNALRQLERAVDDIVKQLVLVAGEVRRLSD